MYSDMYSDEGTRLGPLADLWDWIAWDYYDWLIRPN